MLVCGRWDPKYKGWLLPFMVEAVFLCASPHKEKHFKERKAFHCSLPLIWSWAEERMGKPFPCTAEQAGTEKIRQTETGIHMRKPAGRIRNTYAETGR